MLFLALLQKAMNDNTFYTLNIVYLQQHGGFELKFSGIRSFLRQIVLSVHAHSWFFLPSQT